MNKNAISKILSHPDKDEIISKIIIGKSASDIHHWLKSKYTNVSESKFVISEKFIKSFNEGYVDIYNIIQEDLSKTRSALSLNKESDLELSIKNLPAYKNIALQSINEELDIRKIVKNLCLAIETRFAQIFDEIQNNPETINTRVDRVLIDYTEVLGNMLEKYYKFTEAPANQIVHNNVTLQVVDQHISVFHDVMREVLAQVDLETSLYFIELFSERMAKLKAPDKEIGSSSEIRLAEAKLLNETINKKINE